MADHGSISLPQQDISDRLYGFFISKIDLCSQNPRIGKEFRPRMVLHLRLCASGQQVRKRRPVKFQTGIRLEQPDTRVHKGRVALRAYAPPLPSGRHLELIHLIQRIVKFFVLLLRDTGEDQIRKPVLYSSRSVRYVPSSNCFRIQIHVSLGILW